MKNWKKIALITTSVLLVSGIAYFAYQQSKENKGEGTVDENSKNEPLKILKK